MIWRQYSGVCVCVGARVWPGICRSGGCLQRRAATPQETPPHAWCERTAASTVEGGRRTDRGVWKRLLYADDLVTPTLRRRIKQSVRRRPAAPSGDCQSHGRGDFCLCCLFLWGLFLNINICKISEKHCKPVNAPCLHFNKERGKRQMWNSFCGKSKV